MSTPKTEAAAQWMKDAAKEIHNANRWATPGFFEQIIREFYAVEQARVEELVAAAQSLERRLAELMPKIDAVIVLQTVRAGHNTWTHGSLADEWERLCKALEAFK